MNESKTMSSHHECCSGMQDTFVSDAHCESEIGVFCDSGICTTFNSTIAFSFKSDERLSSDDLLILSPQDDLSDLIAGVPPVPPPQSA